MEVVIINFDDFEEDLIEIKEGAEITDGPFNKIMNFVNEIAEEYPDITPNE